MVNVVSAEQTAELQQQMRGVTVAMATPLNVDGSLDVAGLERLVDRTIRGEASCLFILGWAGMRGVIALAAAIAIDGGAPVSMSGPMPQPARGPA